MRAEPKNSPLAPGPRLSSRALAVHAALVDIIHRADSDAPEPELETLAAALGSLTSIRDFTTAESASTVAAAESVLAEWVATRGYPR